MPGHTPCAPCSPCPALAPTHLRLGDALLAAVKERRDGHAGCALCVALPEELLLKRRHPAQVHWQRRRRVLRVKPPECVLMQVRARERVCIIVSGCACMSVCACVCVCARACACARTTADIEHVIRSESTCTHTCTLLHACPARIPPIPSAS